MLLSTALCHGGLFILVRRLWLLQAASTSEMTWGWIVKDIEEEAAIPLEERQQRDAEEQADMERQKAENAEWAAQEAAKKASEDAKEALAAGSSAGANAEAEALPDAAPDADAAEPPTHTEL